MNFLGLSVEMRDILITGLTTLDLIFKMENFPNKNEKYRADTAMLSGGGNAGNASVAVARLGANSTIFSAVGKDDVGSLILAKLQCENVNTEFVLTIENWQSSFSSVFVDINGERQITNYRNSLPEGAAKSILGFPVYDAYLSDSRWNEAAIATLSLAKKFKKPGILDAEAPVSEQAVDLASHVAFSKQGLSHFTNKDDVTASLKVIENDFNSWACVTDGSNGVYFLEEGTLCNLPAPEIKAKDTLGAGDVWHGAFAVCLAEGKSESEAIKFSNLAAAIKCTKFGGQSSIPTRTEINEFINSK